MASAGGHEYDEHLLSSAPKPDRRALQEGYDPTLLNSQEPKPEKPRPRSSTPRQAASPTPGPGSPTDRERDVEKGVVAPGVVTPKPGPPPPTRATPIATPIKPKPFYKTKKGLLIIGGVLVAVIIAAVVGGVVGGRNRSSSNSGPTGAAADSFSSLTSAAQPGETQGSEPVGDTSTGGQTQPTGQPGGQTGDQDTGPAPTSSGLLGNTGLLGTGTAAQNGQPTQPPDLPPLRRWLD